MKDKPTPKYAKGSQVKCKLANSKKYKVLSLSYFPLIGWFYGGLDGNAALGHWEKDLK